MQLSQLHPEDKSVSTFPLFQGAEGKTISLQILQGQQLKAHVTHVPALLVCITGKALFENEEGSTVELSPGAYVLIAPSVKHWVNGLETSQFLLMK